MLRTITAGEYCESIIRQRCGCKSISSDAESSRGPSSTRSIEDVHDIGRIITCNCATHQPSAVAAHATFRNSQASLPSSRTTNTAINDFNTCYAPWPPANIASPSFGSDVAARNDRATLSDDALAHVPKGAAFTCCAAAMATNMQPVKSRARLLMRKMVQWLMLHAPRLLRSL